MSTIYSIVAEMERTKRLAEGVGKLFEPAMQQVRFVESMNKALANPVTNATADIVAAIRAKAEAQHLMNSWKGVETQWKSEFGKMQESATAIAQMRAQYEAMQATSNVVNRFRPEFDTINRTAAVTSKLFADAAIARSSVLHGMLDRTRNPTITTFLSSLDQSRSLIDSPQAIDIVPQERVGELIDRWSQVEDIDEQIDFVPLSDEQTVRLAQYVKPCVDALASMSDRPQLDRMEAMLHLLVQHELNKSICETNPGLKFIIDIAKGLISNVIFYLILMSASGDAPKPTVQPDPQRIERSDSQPN